MARVDGDASFLVCREIEESDRRGPRVLSDRIRNPVLAQIEKTVVLTRDADLSSRVVGAHVDDRYHVRGDSPISSPSVVTPSPLRTRFE